jgi:hypothetical protein
MVHADLQTLGHTPYQCLLSCHPSGPDHHFFRLIGCGCLHLSMLVPHQVVWHKSLLSNVTKYLILQQHPSVPTPITQTFHLVTVIQEILGDLKPFGKLCTFITKSSYIARWSSTIFNTIKLMHNVKKNK